MPTELPHPPLSNSTKFSLYNAKRGPAIARRTRPATWLLALLLLLLSGAATSALAQGTPPPECAADEKFANTWYFGFKAGLDLNQASADSLPKVLTNGAMDAPAGSGVMSDKDGNILFYSNGRTVWNGDGSVMANGRGLAGDSTTTDGPLPIKLPGLPGTGQPTRYLLFTLNSTVGLSYSEIHIPAGGGPGIVIDSTKNTPLARGTAEKLTGVFHKDGCHIWIITHGWGDAKTGNDNRGDAFLAYRVRQSAGYTGPVLIDAPAVSTVGSLHAPRVAALGYKGQMKVTPDGRRLALARYSEVVAVGDSSSTVELFGFDTESGAVTADPQVPFIVDRGEGKYYGVGFSPGSYLYATVMNPPKLLQFDISGTGPVTKQDIPLNQSTAADLGALQAGPDGRIYVARNNQPALGFIAYPDSLGAAIGYADDSLRLGGRLSGLGLVNFNQSSLLRVGPSFEITGCRQISFTAPPIDFDGKSYLWKFGDGTTSTQENPVHVYARPGNYTVTLRITTECFCRESSGVILVPALPLPGRIAAPQTLCAGTAPALLTSTSAASGDAGLPLVYQWESSRNNVAFTTISGATGETYQPPTSLPIGITYFRRRAQLLLPNQSGPYCAPSYTASVAITILPALTAGRVAANQNVCAGTTPAPLTSTTPATGGNGTVIYQWESSADNITWTSINGARALTYAPGRLTATTYFRRRATAGSACAPVFSNFITIAVTPAIVAGSIAASQALCAGSTPAPFTSTALATGGSGTVAYQWESSVDRITWRTLSGATGATYTPGRLTVTTYYRRRASAGSACAPAFSNILTITVTPALLAGIIAAPQTLCVGTTPARLTSTAGASGGTGTYRYQWESGPNGSTWTPIAGATGTAYSPGPLLATTYYRRAVTSGPCGPVYSPAIILRVLPALAAGSIAADQDICAGAPTAPLTSTSPAGGGTGTFAYQWESSANNTTFRAIVGANRATYAPGLLAATTYFRRRVTSGIGTCATAVSNVVTVRVQPVLTTGVTLAPPPVQCLGTPLTFTAVPTNAGATPTFRWFVNNAPATATGATFNSSTLVSGDRVRVEVTATAGTCSTGPASATVTVTRTPTPLPTLTIAVQPGGPVCPGEPLTFSIANVTNAGPAPAYQWLVNGASVNGATNPVFTSTTLRDGQTVTLRLRTTNVCGQPVTVVSNGIVVRISPPADVDAGPDKEILAGTSVVLEGRVDGPYPVAWTPATGLAFPSDSLRPVASPLVTTTYTLSAGTGGCADSDQVTVTVRPAIRIPNAFTPNSDGRDDTWQIEFIEQYPNNTVTVFNRWGNKVFSADNYSRANEWRGEINGQPAPVGTYYYVVVTRGPLGKSYSGSLTVLY